MNSKSTKKKLTGSIWALVVCFILLLGTTFAWFTDTASTNVNKIQAGELDVALEMWDGEKWVSAEGETLNFERIQKEVGGGDEVVADAEEILWEPGCTYDLPALRVVNNGNLALKYTVEIAALSGDEKLAEVIDVLFLEQKPGENGTAQKIGTLADILNSADEDGFAHGKLAAEATTGTLNISLHMQETAGNEYQGLSIDGIKVTVYATQDTVEFDSNTNEYDKDATHVAKVSSISELRAAIAQNSAAKIVLTDDISITSQECEHINDSYGYCLLLMKNSVDIDFNGHTISYSRNAKDDDVNARFGIVACQGATVNVYDSSSAKTGGIVIDNDEAYCVANGLTSSGYVLYAENGAVINAYGGNFTTSNGVIAYLRLNGNMNIYGGKYESSYYSDDNLLNVPNGSGLKIYVYGGSFKNFQPGVNNKDEAILVKGYKSVKDGAWYNVVPE